MNLYALTPKTEIDLRLQRLRSLMAEENMEAMLISSNANIYYASGRVLNGYVYVPLEGETLYFVRRPVGIEGDNVVYIHKPELIPSLLEERGVKLPSNIGIELAVTDYMTVMRLAKVFSRAEMKNASAVLRKARAVKTPFEIDMLKRSGIKHEEVYRRIPQLYEEGMSDIELQIEIERESRLEGCLGQFRIAGESMEIFMSNVLSGDNADSPTPYDFAMGGAGLDPSLPVGADGTIIKPGMTVMVDSNGNFTGYMTDMTRVFKLENVEDLALKAHQCSIDICRELSAMALPGVAASELYNRAMAMVKERGLEAYFMGYSQKAGFIGHGVGIEINDLPVIAPKSRDVLEENNVIALEPKFVIPHVGAVGIENTYVVRKDGLERITNAPEEIVDLTK